MVTPKDDGSEVDGLTHSLTLLIVITVNVGNEMNIIKNEIVTMAI